MKKIFILILSLGFMISENHAQGLIQLENANITQTPNSHLILQNCSWINDQGTLQADSAWVSFTGTSTDSIGGTPTTFSRLRLNKTAGHIQLKQETQISDSLALASGLLVLDEHDLRLLPGAKTSTGQAAAYIQTAGTGRMWAEVGSSPQLFPIGNSSYRPAILQNSQNPDFFGLRTTNEVLTDGSSGSPLLEEAVGSSWYVKEATPGDSKLALQLQWNAGDELTDFARHCAYLSRYRNRWDKKERASVQGNDPFSINRVNLKQDSLFAILTYRPRRLAKQNCSNCTQIRFDFCEGEAVPDLEALLRNNDKYETGSSFLWFKDSQGAQGEPIGTPNLDMSSNNTRFYWVSQDKYGCESMARRVRVRVRKTSHVDFHLPPIGCEGGVTNLASFVQDSRRIATGFTFWETDPAFGGNPIGSVTATRGQIDQGQSLSVPLFSGTLTYYATAINHTACQVTAQQRIHIPEVPVLDTLPAVAVLPGDTVHIPFTGQYITTSFWQLVNPSQGPGIGLLTSSGVGDLVFTAYNPFPYPIVRHIRVSPFNGNCGGQSVTFTIQILPSINNRNRPDSLNFQASKLNPHDVKLTWNIQYGFAIKHFEVEKATQAEQWETMGRIDFSTNQSVYEMIDRGRMSNVVTYRLKIILEGDRALWSEEIQVHFDFYDSGHFSLFPNPTAGSFTLRSPKQFVGKWRFKLTDPIGKTLLIGALTERETSFNISSQASGFFFLIITNSAGKSYLKRILKQ